MPSCRPRPQTTCISNTSKSQHSPREGGFSTDIEPGVNNLPSFEVRRSASETVLQELRETQAGTTMKNRLDSIQHLRGIAALLVVGFHAAYTTQSHGWPQIYSQLRLDWARLGVDIFFVISGAIMVITANDRPAGRQSAALFMAARLARIVPLYWILTSAELVMQVYAARHRGENFDYAHALASYLFFPSVNRYSGSNLPVLAPGWTLEYELWFYAVFSLSILSPKKWRVPIVATFFIASSLLNLIVGDAPIIGTYTSPLLMEFVFGCAIGLAYQSGAKLHNTLAFSMLSTGLCLLLFTLNINITDTNRFIFWGIPSALIVSGAIFLERAEKWWRVAPLKMLGDSSYSLYLSHAILQHVLISLAMKLDPNHKIVGDVLWTFLVASSVIVGYLCYRLIEAPIHQWLRTRLINARLAITPKQTLGGA